MNFKLSKTIDILLFLCLLLFCITLAINRTLAVATIDGIKMFSICLLPTLFPYLILISLISNTKTFYYLSNKLSPLSKRLFKVNGSVFSCYLLSLLSGYPMGAKSVCDLFDNKLITYRQAQKGVLLASTPSPSFLISTVGTILFGDVRFGLLLFCSSFISSILVGILLSFFSKDKVEEKSQFIKTDFIKIDIFELIYSSTLKVLYIGGIIVAFYIFIELLSHFNVFNPIINLISYLVNDKTLAKGIVYGVIECSKGITIISTCKISKLTLPIISAVCGFGGVSVIMQSAIFVRKMKIKIAPFILSKIISAIIYFVVGFIVSLCFL